MPKIIFSASFYLEPSRLHYIKNVCLNDLAELVFCSSELLFSNLTSRSSKKIKKYLLLAEILIFKFAEAAQMFSLNIE